MTDDQAGRSARAEAARLSRPPRGPLLGWAAGGALLGYTLHPVLTLPGIAAGLLVGWRGHARDPAAAARWAAGAEGEEATAKELAPLGAEGWTVLHDRAIPGSRANLDHLLIGPHGQLVVVDSKQWTRRAVVRLVHGRLRCGLKDRHSAVDTLLWEAQQVARVLGAPVSAVMCVHGPLVMGAPLYADRVVVVGPDRLLSVVRGAAVAAPAHGLARRAAACFPPYVR